MNNSPTTLLAFCAAAIAAAFVVGFCLGRIRWEIRTGFSQSRENQGEADVRRLLTSHFSGPQSHPMNNLTLPDGDGTTQIDHVLVSTKGIFVIESKHYTGWLFANASSPTWTHVIYKQKNKFQNPLRQNYKHVKAIQGLLDFIPTQHIHSLVVFTGDAEFKTERPDSVLDINELVAFISRYSEDVISPNKMHICVGRLECTRRLISGQTDVEHQAYLGRKFGDAT